MIDDRFFAAFASMVKRALDNDKTIDRRALYPAKVVKWQTSGIFPSGTVDVIFNNDDAGNSATLLQTISDVPVLPPVVGMVYQPQPGTQCLIGWQGADERLPYATGWLGLGGAARIDVVSSLVNLGDTSGQALLNKAFFDELKKFVVTLKGSTDPAVQAAATALDLAMTRTPFLFYTNKTKAS